MCFGFRISSLIHLATLTIPRIRSGLKTPKMQAGTHHFHLKCSEDFVVFTHAHTAGLVVQTKSVFAGTAVQAPLRNSACVWLWWITFNQTFFSESEVNPQGLNCTSNGNGGSPLAFLAFLGHFWFWMGIVRVARWIRLKILNPKHMQESKIGLLEQIWASKR